MIDQCSIGALPVLARRLRRVCTVIARWCAQCITSGCSVHVQRLFSVGSVMVCLRRGCSAVDLLIAPGLILYCCVVAPQWRADARSGCEVLVKCLRSAWEFLAMRLRNACEVLAK